MNPGKSRLLVLAACSLALMLCGKCLAQERADARPNQETGSKIVVDVDNVLVPVVVRDAHGHALGNLTMEDFQIFDEGKPQPITSFTVAEHSSAPVNSATSGPAASGNFSLPTATTQRFIVFLIDDMHLGSADLMRTKKTAAAMLADSLSPSDMAAVVSISGANSGLTRDRAKLQDAFQKLTTHSLYKSVSDCPNIDFYQADLIQNRHDSAALEAATEEVSTCAHLDPKTMHQEAERMAMLAASRALAIGEQDARGTLGVVKEYVRRMSTLRGQRTLILVTAGFLTSTTEAMKEKSQIIDFAGKSLVTISALDARGLYTTGLDASERGGISARDLATGSSSQNHREALNYDENVMAELADGTGGSYFHNGNDLADGFHQLTAEPEYVYLLEFALDAAKQTGRYHRIKVHVDKEGVRVQARGGYFADKLPKK
jgi:VWFA-related protein